jgi:hypothetical protein
MLKEQFENRTDKSGFSPRKLPNLRQAVALFDRLAANRRIPHGQLQSGCHERATVMCDLMIQAGFEPKKSWMFFDKSDLNFRSQQGDTIYWWYHVAPALEIGLPNGDRPMLVFDPSLYDGPVLLRDWGRPMIDNREEPFDRLMTDYNACLYKCRKKDFEICDDTRWQYEVEAAKRKFESVPFLHFDHAVHKTRLRHAFSVMTKRKTQPEKCAYGQVVSMRHNNLPMTRNG